MGETPKLLEPGDLVTVTDESEIALKPGEQVKLTVRIERRNGFLVRDIFEHQPAPVIVHVPSDAEQLAVIAQRE